VFFSFNARAIGVSASASETIRIAAETGFAGVDLMVRDILDSGEDLGSLRRLMSDQGLAPGAFPMPINWRGDEPAFRRDLDQLGRCADAAAALGLTRTGTWIMPETPAQTADDASNLRATASLHRDRLGAIAEVLNARGIQLGLEVIGVESFRTGKGVPFVTRIDQLDERLGPITELGPNVGILADVFHLHAAGESIEAPFAWGIDRIVWVHVADLPAGPTPQQQEIDDQQRGLPGENGAVDVERFLWALEDRGYSGPITVEPMAGCRSLAGLTPIAKARAVADSIRRVFRRGTT
jgi:sugar phosphate isomerase/epimerase